LAEVAGLDQLAEHRPDEVLLALDALVVAVDPLAGAHVRQRLGRVHLVDPGLGELGAGLAVHERLVELDRDATEGVDHVDEAAERHLRVVVDRAARRSDAGLDDGFGPAGEDVGDLGERAVLALDDEVARDGDQARPASGPR
jgi:hypothetical protein